MSKIKTKAAQKPEKASVAKKKNSDKAGDSIAFLTEDVQGLMEIFVKEESVDSMLTASERRRLISAGVKNYGFIDKAYDIARDNPTFLPPFLSAQDIWQDMHVFEETRQLVMVLEKFLQLATECMMVRGDQCFRDALRVYSTLQEMSRNRVPGALPLFESLMSFFRRRRRPGEKEMTIKQLERKADAIISGTEDGEM